MWKTIWEPCVLEYSNLRYVWFYISKSVCLLGGTLISPKSSIAMSHGKKGRSSQVIVEKSNSKSWYLYAYFHTLYTVIHTDTIPLFCSKPFYIFPEGSKAFWNAWFSNCFYAWFSNCYDFLGTQLLNNKLSKPLSAKSKAIFRTKNAVL